MEDLIKALTILSKYISEENRKYPTWCDHDVLGVNVSPEVVSEEDKEELWSLGFVPDTDEYDCFISFRYGSC